VVGRAAAGVFVAGKEVLVAAIGVLVVGARVLLAAAAGETAGNVVVAGGVTAATTAVSAGLGDRVRVARGPDAAAGVGTCTPTS